MSCAIFLCVHSVCVLFFCFLTFFNFLLFSPSSVLLQFVPPGLHDFVTHDIWHWRLEPNIYAWLGTQVLWISVTLVMHYAYLWYCYVEYERKSNAVSKGCLVVVNSLSIADENVNWFGCMYDRAGAQHLPPLAILAREHSVRWIRAVSSVVLATPPVCRRIHCGAASSGRGKGAHSVCLCHKLCTAAASGCHGSFWFAGRGDVGAQQRSVWSTSAR